MKKKILIKASGITAPSWRGYNAGVGRSTLMLLKSLAKISNLPFDTLIPQHYSLTLFISA